MTAELIISTESWHQQTDSVNLSTSDNLLLWSNQVNPAPVSPSVREAFQLFTGGSTLRSVSQGRGTAVSACLHSGCAARGARRERIS